MSAPDWVISRPIAHRGLHHRAAGRIENTLSAAAAAVAQGYAIECDLQVTADGRVIVFHDDTLDRLTDATGPIEDWTLAEIRTVRLIDSGEKIPTLAELLAVIGGRVPLFLEMKSHWRGDLRLETETARLIAGYDGLVAVMSFDPDSVGAMRRLSPTRPRGLVADRFDKPEFKRALTAARRRALQDLVALTSVGADFVAYGIEALADAPPQAARRLGWPTLTWTVRDADDHQKARSYAHQIIFEDFDPTVGD